MHELTTVREKIGTKEDEKEKEEAVEYSLGNETIIQPKQQMRDKCGPVLQLAIF